MLELIVTGITESETVLLQDNMHVLNEIEVYM